MVEKCIRYMADLEHSETAHDTSHAKRMLYLMNVNWNWIKQRPQYLAEALSEFYRIDVYDKVAYRRSRLVKNSVDSISLHHLFCIPFGRYSMIHKVNDIMDRLRLKSIIKNYDYIWIADINYFRAIKPYITKKQCIIYDCMDDIVEFPAYAHNTKLRTRYIKDETALLNNCSIIFTSANHLKEVLRKRHHDIDANKIYVVNNAVSDLLLTRHAENSPILRQDKTQNTKKVITYIGTISEWIDWNLILKSLEIFTNIEYHFYGPIVGTVIPNHARICYKGVLKQDKIAGTMHASDLLIMPFQVNPLIESVNPVKLYEYILSGVPSLACGYGESEKFLDYVYLYYNEKDYMQFISRLLKGKLPNKSENGKSFVRNNTWSHRAKEIHDILNTAQNL